MRIPVRGTNNVVLKEAETHWVGDISVLWRNFDILPHKAHTPEERGNALVRLSIVLCFLATLRFRTYHPALLLALFLIVFSWAPRSKESLNPRTVGAPVGESSSLIVPDYCAFADRDEEQSVIQWFPTIKYNRSDQLKPKWSFKTTQYDPDSFYRFCMPSKKAKARTAEHLTQAGLEIQHGPIVDINTL